MKMQATKFLSPLQHAEITKLSTDVKEILVPGYKKNEGRILSTADLWNIQRSKRVRLRRRFL